MLNRIIFISLFVSLSHQLIAQKDQEIESVEVVSLPIPLTVDKTGRSVTIINSKTLNALPVSSIEEALRSVAGININSRGGFGVQSDIGMRGSTFSQVLVLIDGIRWNESLTGHLNNNIPIPLHEVDKIEVVRGAASGIYGSDAVGGVIHIHTKTFNQIEHGVQFSGNALAGEHSLGSLDAALQLKKKALSLSGGIKTIKADGQQYSNPNYTAGISEDEYYHSDFDIQTYTVAAQYDVAKKVDVAGRYALDKRDFNAKYFYTTSPYDESVENVKSQSAQVKGVYNQENGQTSLNVGYKKTNDNFDFNPLFSANEHETKQWVGILNQQWRHGDNQFVLGSQYISQDIASTDRGHHKQQQFELYSTANLVFGDYWSTLLSLRGGHHDQIGFLLNPQISTSYARDRWIVRSSIGRAERGADFTERFVSYNIPNLSPGRNIGNPDLKAEKSWTADLGGDFLLPKQLKVSSTAFYRDSKDLIDYTIENANNIDNVSNLQPNEEYYQAQNVGQVKTFGLELELSKTWALSNDWNIELLPNYTYLHTSFNEERKSKYLANHPNHEVNVLLGVQSDRVGFNWTNQWVSRNQEALEKINAEVPHTYLVSNINLDLRLWDKLKIEGRVNNLFDTDYQEILGAQMPNRWFSAGVSWDVNRP